MDGWLPQELVAALRRMGLAGPCAPLRATCLAGGVSSDIWRVDLESGPICVKRALARLRVQAEWRAPLERNVYEARWMRRAGSACPGSAPELLGHDPETGMLAMAYLPPQSYPLWKDQLRAGLAEPAFAAKVGERLACIHAATASDPAVAAEFPSAAIFEAIRIEPYLIASAEAHPGLASRLGELAEVTRRTRRALVHGDVSPKNILAGPTGPVFLDAECACWGDPAFDLAFCLNHLLLKCLWTPNAKEAFLACFAALSDRYLGAVEWETAAELEARAANLLPGLLLARIDGKSPVEYITTPEDKDLVRGVAGHLLSRPRDRLRDVQAAWRQALPA